MDQKLILYLASFIIVGIAINAVCCPLAFIVAVRGMQSTGYLSPPSDPAAADQELSGAAMLISIMASTSSIVIFSGAAAFIWLLQKYNLNKVLIAALAALTGVCTLFGNLMLTFFFLAWLIGMHST